MNTKKTEPVPHVELVSARELATKFKPYRKDPNMPGTYITAPRLALRLGVKTETLAAWRRKKKGPDDWFYLSPILVAYPLEAVERFEAERKKAKPAFGTPPAAPPGGWPRHKC